MIFNEIDNACDNNASIQNSKKKEGGRKEEGRETIRETIGIRKTNCLAGIK